MIVFTLYSRSYCHLCEDMRVALEQLLTGVVHRIDIVDIDLDDQLVALYDELVPVLFGKKTGHPAAEGVGQQLCHYFLDPDAVRAFCHE